MAIDPPAAQKLNSTLAGLWNQCVFLRTGLRQGTGLPFSPPGGGPGVPRLCLLSPATRPAPIPDRPAADSTHTR